MFEKGGLVVNPHLSLYFHLLHVLSSFFSFFRSVHKVPGKRGGTTPAKALLALFLRDRLKGYATHRKEAWRRHSSFLSPYLHFGHISPLAIALKVGRQIGGSSPS